jgi:predicted nucleic acid-binding protein
VDQVRSLRGQILALDTAPLIYYIEDHPLYAPRVDPFFAAAEQGELTIVTATITLVKVLVQPFRQGDVQLMRRYRDILLNAAGVRAVPLTPAIAEVAARLRAAHRLSPPDAIQLATGLTEGAASFLTNDRRLPQIPSLPLLLVDEL